MSDKIGIYSPIKRLLEEVTVRKVGEGLQSLKHLQEPGRREL